MEGHRHFRNVLTAVHGGGRREGDHREQHSGETERFHLE